MLHLEAVNDKGAELRLMGQVNLHHKNEQECFGQSPDSDWIAEDLPVCYRQSFFSFCTYRGGYAGTATFCRASLAPVAAESGLTGAATQGKESSETRVGFPEDVAFWNK